MISRLPWDVSKGEKGMRTAVEMAQWVKHLPHKHEAKRIWVLILVGVSARVAPACDPSRVAGGGGTDR